VKSKENMVNEALLPTFQRTDDRGTFIEVLNSGRWEALIFGRMQSGAVMGNHYHRKTEIFFFLTKGSARIDTVHVETQARGSLSLLAEQGVVLEANESHAIRFLEDSEFIMLKSLRHDPADPDTFPYPVPE
jgi:dTDP-4-dehydrorhamnose 3,5-epimerase-like enzyme